MNEELTEPVLAMYDVRGIQKYIFRTAKVKDAIGASYIIESIILDALKYALKKVNNEKVNDEKVTCDYEWFDANAPKKFEDGQKDIQVLYIGGGNAYVIFSSRALCIRINKIMAKYVIEETYSLQLAVAVVKKSKDYRKDYKSLHEEMNRVKADMSISKPLGALPVMKVDVNTGYPLNKDKHSVLEELKTAEIQKKQEQELQKRRGIKKEKKIFDNYSTLKGVDSTIAVVHIDGNNMGLRIKGRIEHEENYEEAVNIMRKISYNIDSAYKTVFNEMRDYFNQNAHEHNALSEKKTDDFVLEILAAGDDITYVCNGKIALDTVEYYCKRISQYTMLQEGREDENIQKYGFSVCAGVAFIGSHFPFSVGYQVAEECCDSAKERAKQEQYKDGDRIGNWVDFHICKNIQAQNLKSMRKKEYLTSGGENLLLRPYFISTDADGKLSENKNLEFSYDKLKKYILYFQNEENIPHSFAKNLRNIYSQGKMETQEFLAFLTSRNWKLPDEDLPYISIKDGKGQEKVFAKYYDALEIMDYYVDISQLQQEEKDESISDEDRTA